MKVIDIFLKKVKKFFILLIIYIINFISINSGFFANSAFAFKANDILEGFSYIPAVGTIIKGFEYFTKLGINISVDEETDSSGGGVSNGTLSKITDYISGAFSPATSSDFNSIRTFQDVFGSNQYCSDQVIYREEQKYISKQGSNRPKNGYSIFPVYPNNIRVRNNLCTIDDEYIKKNFPEVKVIDTPFSVGKCSFSYSIESEDCVKGGAKLLIEYYGISMAVSAIEQACSPGDKDKVEDSLKQAKKSKKMIKASKNVLNKGVESFAVLYELFNDSLFNDPYTYIGLLTVTSFAEFMLDDLFSLLKMAAKFNWGCFFSILISKYSITIALKSVVDVWNSKQYEKAKSAIKNITFCGHDWYSYNRKNFDILDTNSGNDSLSAQEAKILPLKGAYENSRFKKIRDCIKNHKDGGCALELLENYCDYNCGSGEKKVKPYDKDVRNRNYREYIYEGKEYKVNDKGNWYIDIEKNLDTDDNRTAEINYDYSNCIDPRLPEKKGTENFSQMYYMKGNEKANFACERFYYDGKSGCIIKNTKIIDNNDQLIKIKNSDYYIVPSTDQELLDKYSAICSESFKTARECCRFRSQNFICLENKSSGDSTFCISNIIADNDFVQYNNLLEYLKTLKKDKIKPTCEIKDGQNTIQFEASKKIDTNKVCVFSYNVCPYNFRLNAGINYKASFCDTNSLDIDSEGEEKGTFTRSSTHFNKSDCEKGYFVNENKVDYNEVASSNDFGINDGKYNNFIFDKIAEDMKGFNKNDFNIIYNFDIKDYKEDDVFVDDNDNKNKKYSYALSDGDTNLTYEDFAAYSNGNIYKIKNFCQYSAHCIEVDKENNSYDDLNSVSLFLDSSCSGESNNSRTKNLAGISKNSIKQLSSPIVECIYESLNNLVRGVSGCSKCSNGYSINNNGYCGSDTQLKVKEAIENNNLSFLNKYKKIDEKYIIKGYPLPKEYNPFMKLQSNLVKAIRALIVLFVALFFILKLISDDFDVFGKLKPGQIVSKVLQFAIVLWLSIGSGMQNVVYDKIVSFSLGFYETSVNLFSKVINSDFSYVLKQDEVVRKATIKQKIAIENNQLNDFYVCFRESLINNMDYKEPYSNGSCPTFYKKQVNDIIIYTGKNKTDTIIDNGNLVIRNNQAINKLLYFIDEYNKTTSNKLSLENISNDNIWSDHYDGCYFDPTEYPDGKSYLSIFDMLDCKFAKYIGYSYNSGLPNLFIYAAMLLVPSIFNDLPVIGSLMSFIGKIFSMLGHIIFVIMMTFFFGFFTILTKIMYTFLSAFFTLSILLFLTPLILPFLLFEKTKKIAESWIQNIIGTITTPILNIVLMLIFVSFLDAFLSGGFSIVKVDALTFVGHNGYGRAAKMVCSNNSSNVLCFLNEVPVFGQIITLLKSSNGLLLLLNLLVAVALIKFGDELINSIESFVGKFVSFGGSAPGTVSDGGGKLSESYKTASSTMEVGEKIANTVVRAPQALVGVAAKKIDQSRSDNIKNRENVIANNNSEIEKLRKEPIKNAKKIEKLQSKNEKLSNANKKSADSKNISDASFTRFITNPGNFIGDKIQNAANKTTNIHAKRFYSAMQALDKITQFKIGDAVEITKDSIKDNEEYTKLQDTIINKEEIERKNRNKYNEKILKNNDKINKLSIDITKKEKKLKELEERTNGQGEFYNKQLDKVKNEKFNITNYESTDEKIEKEIKKFN